MIRNSHMASMTKIGRETGESRSEVVRKIMLEALAIEYESKIVGIDVENRLKFGYSKSSIILKNFIVEKFAGRITSVNQRVSWDQVISELKNEYEKMKEIERWKDVVNEEAIEWCKEKEREMEKFREEKQLIETVEIMRSMRILSRNVTEMRIQLTRMECKCRICGRKGHKAYECVEERVEFVNKKSKADEIVKMEKERDDDNEYIEQPEKLRVEAVRNLDRMVNNRGKLKIEELVTEFPIVLDSADKPIEFCSLEKCKINTADKVKVVKRGQKIPQAFKKEIIEYFKDLERKGIIRKTESEWRSPIRAIPKPNGGIRIVSNLMALNDLVEKDPYELRNIRDILGATQGSVEFTVLDLKDGFYHIEIEESDKHKTAFEVEGVVYEWNGMVMGFKNAPQIMQRTMNKVLGDVIGRGVEVYMDDIVIHGKTREEHNKLVREVLKRLEKHKMRVNPKKVQLSCESVKLLGVTIDGKTMTPDEIKKNEALEYPIPKNVSELRRFLGLSGWFRNFIKNYAGKTLKLTDALKGKNKEFKWTEEMNSEFEGLKQSIKVMKDLILPDYEKQFMLRTDACGTGMGAVLLQKNQKGEWCPVQWASKKFTPTERRYGISEMEMLAVYWGVKKFEYELRGRKFILVSDHKALQEIRKKAYFNNSRINRWIELIQEFDFEIQYNKGEELAVPDALSRLYEAEERTDESKIKKESRGKKVK